MFYIMATNASTWFRPSWNLTQMKFTSFTKSYNVVGTKLVCQHAISEPKWDMVYNFMPVTTSLNEFYIFALCQYITLIFDKDKLNSVIYRMLLRFFVIVVYILQI